MENPITRRTLVIGSVAASVAAALPASTVAARARQAASPEAGGSALADLDLPEITVTIAADAFTVSESEIAAGRYLVTVENQHEEILAAVFQEMPDDATIEEMTALLTDTEVTAPPDWYYTVHSAGGATARPGESIRFVVDLEAGRYMVHWDNVVPGLSAHQLIVTGDMPEDLPLIDADVTIEMVEMAFNLSGDLSSGDHVVEVINAGAQPHFAEFLGVPDGTTVEDFMDLVASFGGGPDATPAETRLSMTDISPAFMTGVLSPGATMWSELSLDPGTYLLVCFVPDTETGIPHAMLGMVDVYIIE
jgi:hypothetical protein